MVALSAHFPRAAREKVGFKSRPGHHTSKVAGAFFQGVLIVKIHFLK
jgi:hypothetical protein